MSSRNEMRAALAVILLAALALTAAAQQVPPRLIHYQGRLTGINSQPITSQQTMWFSIFQGGDANTANSGTLRYRERAAVTPNNQGIFEHRIGSGVIESGAINPDDFNTTPIFLQVAIGSVGNVLLPRTEMTSVGFAFTAHRAQVAQDVVGNITPQSIAIAGVGQIINNQGQWVGPAIPGSTPLVSSIVDVTGGATVPGDLIRLSGRNLNDAIVWIGDRPARIKSRSAAQMEVQVPAGLPLGANEVRVARVGTPNEAQVAGSINLLRYLVLIAGQQNRILFINPTDLSLAGRIDNINIGMPSQGGVDHIQTAFAHEGALLLVPSNLTNVLYAIDMTANPIALVQQFQPTNVTRPVGVAVNPSQTQAAVADRNGNRVRLVTVQEAFPPYSTPLANISTISHLHPPVPPTFYFPRSLHYMTDNLLIVHGELGRLLNYQFRYVRANNRFEWGLFPLTPAVSGFSNQLTTGVGSRDFILTQDRRRGLLLTDATENLEADWLSNWYGPGAAGAPEVAGSGARQIALSPDESIFIASPADDVIRMLQLTGNQLDLVGLYQRPVPFIQRTGERFLLAAVEPALGRLLVTYINSPGNQFEALMFFTVEGAVITRIEAGSAIDPGNRLDDDGRLRLETAYANSQMDEIVAMFFTP